MLLSDEDKLSISKEQAQASIDYTMGGRAAEELIFGHFTTGASSDIKQATRMARRMVCEWGMGKIGPISLGEDSGQDSFLGGQNIYSEALRASVDKEIHDLVNGGYSRALAILTKHKGLLDFLSKALSERETLSGTEIDQLVQEHENESQTVGV